MSKLGWYWHRLRAMSAGEMALHARKKLRQAVDAKRTSWPEVALTCSGAFPKLPKPEDAPEVLRAALRRDVENILAGRWRFFGHLELQVDDPPQWQFDYLVRRDVETTASAFKLNYRSLADGVDSKLVWEPSRWNQLVRLAMAAYVLGDRRAGEKCVEWLEDWVKHNPPYRGWNWTSALEVGLRLIQFAWIDALLGDLRFTNDDLRAEGRSGNAAAAGHGQSATQFFADRLAQLRRAILPPHVWFAWRHKSFGSSANNHLLGELAGCIVATARWPGLAGCGTSLDELQRRWEHEVLAQFAEDGGNKEQALNYHLFSWELCWQAQMALVTSGRKLSPEVGSRMARALRFFWEVQARTEAWDYGDSDDASAVPFHYDDQARWQEWRVWAAEYSKSPILEYWLGSATGIKPRLGVGPPLNTVDFAGWWIYPDSHIALRESGFWWFRWDLSPLGYGSMAAHGHLDVLHLSIWFRGVGLIIDPGTGAYYADKRLREWLSSREAHNGPCPISRREPRRLGPFLWSGGHSAARTSKPDPDTLEAKHSGVFRRVRPLERGDGWKVEDGIDPDDGLSDGFTVRWQFAPGSWVKRHSDRSFSVHRADVAVMIELDENWAEIELGEPVGDGNERNFTLAPFESLDGVVSPAFRKISWAPYLKLVARPRGDKPCVFTTTFLACPD